MRTHDRDDPRRRSDPSNDRAAQPAQSPGRHGRVHQDGQDRVRHSRYQKTLQRTTRLYAHDEVNNLKEGDRVRVQETRPTSKLKRWRVIEVLERAR